MLQEALARFEVRLRAEAPALLDDLRVITSLATPAPLSVASSTGGEGEAEPATAVAGRDRYADMGRLGQGGMGEVRRVRDRELNRVVALKQVLPDVVGPAMLARFVEEVQTTAQLQHPGIVPVYDAGRTADGGVFFTMREVRGRELSEVIRSVHAASRDGWGTSADGWSLRRLVGALHQASQTVAYAHERGVIHRDLKPSNVMVGEYGEVLVMDWGLAKVRGRSDLQADAVAVERSRSATRSGRVMGTPAYMSPEQARGDVEGTDARTDVYALGAMLYEALAGRPPYQGRTGAEVVTQVLAGPPTPVGSASRGGGAGSSAATIDWEAPLAEEAPSAQEEGAPGLLIPDELAAACERAMARSPEDRYPTATAFAEALASWLDGSQRREQALAVVLRAAEQGPAAAALRSRAAALRAAAVAALEGVAGWQPEDDKAAAWAKEDEAAALEGRAGLSEVLEEQLLQASLTHAPDLPEAHAALAERYRREHAAREAAREDASRPEVLLRQHLAALPDGHPARRAGAAYLKGDGALTLITDPPGAEVSLLRYELRNRRLVAVPDRELGRTPLRAVPLARGSWLCVLRHPERVAVRYPVSLGRGEHWDGVPPGAAGPLPVRLPRIGALGPEDCYLPAGWFWSGGDREARNSLPRRRLWIDGQVFRRFPVRNREYLAFLDALVAAGREDEALRHVPRERSGAAGEPGSATYAFDGRRFSLRPDEDGDAWDPEWPVFQVEWHGAAAFAAWEAARTGEAWGLPGELGWEKAARGVDGRLFPWGDHADPSWSCQFDSHRGRPLPSVVDSYPVDESVYGVRGLSGNVNDWCAEAYRPEGPSVVGARVAAPEAAPPDAPAYRVVRGGCWGFGPSDARIALRAWSAPENRGSSTGFRLARPFP